MEGIVAVRIYSVWVIVLMGSFIFSSTLEAEVYKWVDENGKTHYSDQSLGAKEVEFVDDSERITYSKPPAKAWKNKKPRGLASRKLSPTTGQQQKPTRVEGSSSNRQSARGTSTGRY